jgi:hypothetical protein
MFLLYHSDQCNTSETVFYWCYVNDLHTTHAVVCWVTTPALAVTGPSPRSPLPGRPYRGRPPAHRMEAAVVLLVLFLWTEGGGGTQALALPCICPPLPCI